jgi:hypothetical protein
VGSGVRSIGTVGNVNNGLTGLILCDRFESNHEPDPSPDISAQADVHARRLSVAAARAPRSDLCDPGGVEEAQDWASAIYSDGRRPKALADQLVRLVSTDGGLVRYCSSSQAEELPLFLFEWRRSTRCPTQARWADMTPRSLRGWTEYLRRCLVGRARSLGNRQPCGCFDTTATRSRDAYTRTAAPAAPADR